VTCLCDVLRDQPVTRIHTCEVLRVLELTFCVGCYTVCDFRFSCTRPLSTNIEDGSDSGYGSERSVVGSTSDCTWW
jgi:hypothetical protein